MFRNKTRFFISLTIIILLIAIFLDYIDNAFSWHDILVEFHGLVFDLFVLGILLTTYEKITEKKEKIERYHEEIDDFRHRKGKEAKFRIIGNIKRLYDLGVTEFNLMHCYLKNGDLKEYDFTNSNFYFANLNGASLLRSNLQNCKMGVSDLSNSNLSSAQFDNADLFHSSLVSATIINCSFRKTNLANTTFEKATIINSNFENANMKYINLNQVKVYNQDWFEQLKSFNVEGIDKIMDRYEIHDKTYSIDEIGEYWIITPKISI